MDTLFKYSLGKDTLIESGNPSSDSRPLIVLMPDSMDWILGTWCEAYRAVHADRFAFLVLPMREYKQNPAFADRLLREADVVHCLTQWGYKRAVSRMSEEDRASLLLVSTVHHIVEVDQVEAALDADRILTVCKSYRDQLVQMGVASEKLHMTHNGVDASFFQPSDRNAARRRLELPLEATVVGFSGKASSDHDGRKGIDRFVALLEQLDPRLESPMVVLTTGLGWDEKLKPGAFQNIQFRHLGFVEKEILPCFYAALDLYLTTARVEGGPVPVIEAMSCGRPVAATPVGIVPEVFESGKNGFILDADDIARMAETVYGILHNKDQLQLAGEEARKTVLDKLTWEQTLKPLVGLYALDRPVKERRYSGLELHQLHRVLVDRDQYRWRKETHASIGESLRFPGRAYSELSQDWAQSTVSYLKSVYDEGTGQFLSTEGKLPTLYGTVYGYQTLHYIGLDSEVPSSVREYAQSCQDSESGLLKGPELWVHEPKPGVQHDLEHLSLHSTCSVLPFCQDLGIPLKPISSAHVFCDLNYLKDWISKRDWKYAWFEGNNILFVGQLLSYLRDVEQHTGAAEALQYWFDWLDRDMDPKTGLWGTNGFCSKAAAVYGGYHQLLVYYHEGHKLPSIPGLVDTVLSLQHLDGGFNPEGNAGACEDVDSVDILVNCYKRSTYKLAEIRVALWRCVDHILSTQNPDGGFPYRLNKPQSHMGIPETDAPPNVSCMFPTWFRIHTLALCAEVIPEHPALKGMSFRFNSALSMGWHRSPEGWQLELTKAQLDKERYLKKVASRQDRMERFKQYPRRAKGVARRLLSRGKRLLRGNAS